MYYVTFGVPRYFIIIQSLVKFSINLPCYVKVEPNEYSFSFVVIRIQLEVFVQ